ncbi:MAG: hypothetical protein JXM73_09155, partial [Anaerolineae bacterium]|nr:hypothetical protein [Anaerolineae bacterium]
MHRNGWTASTGTSGRHESESAVDMRRKMQEVQAGVENWIRQIEANPHRHDSVNVSRNLASLVQVSIQQVPSPQYLENGSPSFMSITKTT